MKTYVGTKIIQATPMSRAEYNVHRNWELPADEEGADDGYLVEYTDGGKPNHPLHAGYVSWSPKAQFEGAYRETSGLTFGQALEMLKKGAKVARAGWNGKGMWLAISCNGSREITADKFWSPHAGQHALDQGGTATVLPCIIMKTATGEVLMGWLASQTDMLAEDWVVLP